MSISKSLTFYKRGIRTARKSGNGSYMYVYQRNLPIGHSHFRTKIMLKITEHTSPSDTGINIHYNDL